MAIMNERNPMQAMLDAISESNRLTRAQYHVTLGKVIVLASKATGTVRFSDGGSPGDEMSYRGYYSDLSFDMRDGSPKPASVFLEQCVTALGKTYEGYKGGDFTMTENTPLWRASYGCCGDAIVQAAVDETGDIILHCLALSE
jgi:hypothetical protein